MNEEGRKKRILVVEDDEQTRRIYSLKIKGYQLVCASDGRQGFEYFKRDKPDLLITDLFMSRLSGTELIRKVRELDSRTPILVVTGADDADLKFRDAALEAGANKTLSKPLNREHILDAIRELLGNYTA